MGRIRIRLAKAPVSLVFTFIIPGILQDDRVKHVLRRTLGKHNGLGCQCSVADPHPLDRDSDPTCHSDADPDSDCHFDADPDLGFQIKVQTLEKVLK